MMTKALKLNRKNQGVADKLPADEAATKQKHEQLMLQAATLQAQYDQITRDIQEVESSHQSIEQALAACERNSAATLLQYGARLPRAASMPDVAMFPIDCLKQELELLYERRILLYRTEVAESKLSELNAIWDNLEELKENERCRPPAAVRGCAAALFLFAVTLTLTPGRLAAMKRFKQACLADSSKWVALLTCQRSIPCCLIDIHRLQGAAVLQVLHAGDGTHAHDARTRAELVS
jgi:hypothetical protein